MSQPFVGEIRLFAGNFAPVGWAFCDGTLLPISENETLFNLIGTTYGGDGQLTFALPDLRGRVPIHQGSGPGLTSRTMGEIGGVEQVTLTVQQIPAHTHAAQCRAGTSNSPSPAGSFWGASDAAPFITPAAMNASMDSAAFGSAGGSQPHDNMMPFLGVNFIISLFGIYPTPN